jgi:hypothetical protein
MWGRLTTWGRLAFGVTGSELHIEEAENIIKNSISNGIHSIPPSHPVGSPEIKETRLSLKMCLNGHNTKKYNS